MNALFDALFGMWPAILAGVVGALIPRKEGVGQRLGLGAIAFFLILAVQWLWPTEAAQAAAAGGARQPREPI